MNVFNSYSRVYDLLYRDKDYEAESRFVHGVIQKYAPNAKSILELGCGTGAHALKLASLGYGIHGVDLSDRMLERAHGNRSRTSQDIASNISFTKADIRWLKLNKEFDAVISLFHVISYLTADSDLKRAFASAKTHLKKGGIFLFDCWYGPALLTDRPMVRVKRVEDENVSIVRIAEPMMHANKNLVEINYQLFVKDLSSGKLEILEETHTMRYLFKPEITSLLEEAGFELIECHEWMTGRPPGFDTWYVYFVGRA